MALMHRFGPDRDIERVSMAAQSAGFDVALREVVLAVPADIEDVVEEDAVAWTGFNHLRQAMLVVELPQPKEPGYSGGFNGAEIKAFEAQFSWPSYTDQVSIVVPLADGRLDISRSEAKAMLRASHDGFEIIDRIEALGVGRVGTLEIIVHRPIRSGSLETAIEVLAGAVPLPARGAGE